MRRVVLSLGLILCVVLAGALNANAQSVPPIPNRPAATLLLPYFEVDLDNAAGMTTLFSINNASATAILAHVVLWSDMGVPVFGYNIYLTGYDIQTINVRDVLLGTVSRTASAGQDFGSGLNAISPKGILSQDINFASCSGILPPPPVPAVYQPYLRSALTGGPSSFHAGKCVARNLGTPSIARGYITVDTVNNCTLRLHGDPGYFGPGGSGDVTNQNTLWGDYTYINQSADLAYGDALVHITANATAPETSVPGQYTFYGRFDNWTAADNREPLATSFAARFVAPKDFKTAAKARRRAVLPPATELVVWRDSKVTPAPFTCGAPPAWFPLQQEQIRAFNEQEQGESPTFSTPPFPGATQRVALANAAFPLTAYSGWIYLNLNTPIASSPNPPEDTAATQAWVTILQRVQQGPNGGRYDVGFRAVRLDSAEQASHVVIP
jgi:hypothetical protein